MPKYIVKKIGDKFHPGQITESSLFRGFTQKTKQGYKQISFGTKEEAIQHIKDKRKKEQEDEDARIALREQLKKEAEESIVRSE